MLRYFPKPYEDELLYSCIARYAIHTGLIHNNRTIIRDVFNSSTATATPDLPSHLEVFVENVRPVWRTSVREIIISHTLAPFYAPFLPYDQAKQVIASMSSEDGGNRHTRSGVTASTIQALEYFRYCPHCLEAQYQLNGEPYWKRMHQIPIVNICPIHHCKLLISPIHYYAKTKYHFYPLSLIQDKQKTEAIQLTTVDHRLLSYLRELLTIASIDGFGHAKWTAYYRQLAHDLRLIKNGRPDHEGIYEKIKWTGKQSYFLDSVIQSSSDNWIKEIFRKHRKSFHPVRHLFILAVLEPDNSLQSVFQKLERLSNQISPRPRPKIPAQSDKDSVKVHRDQWRTLVLEYPKFGVKQLRTQPEGGKLYAWLYRNDYQWLMDNKPERQVQTNKTKIDYKALDTSTLELLEGNYQKALGLATRVRFTKTYFINSLSKSRSVEKNINRLPKSQQWISAHTESVEDYQIVRLRKANEAFRRLGKKPQRWELIRKSNIRKELITDRINRVINELMRYNIT